MFDIVIIGAGVIGTAIARNLSKYRLNIGLIEKEKDISLGASKANSGIVHGGYAGKAGTLKGELCIKGNQMYDQLNEELNFGFKRIGGLILGFNENDRMTLEKIVQNGHLIGQDDFIWLDQQALREKEPNINPDVEMALYIPSIGVTSPYELTIALAENAVKNGVKLLLEHCVETIEYNQNYFVKTNKGIIESKIVINAAGINSGLFNDCFNKALKIKPRRGQYVLFGKDQSHLVHHVIFQPPTNYGKGILVTQTFHGNFMIGPDAEDLFDDVNTDTSIERLSEIITKARLSINDFNIKRALTTFSGIRAISENGDFFIKKVHQKFITVGGIDSPGLTSAPAIADYVKNIVGELIPLKEDKKYNPYRSSYYDDHNETLVCLCEQKHVGLVKKCFDGPIKIDSTDAVKRRMRAGMGNCQGHRCQSHVQSLIHKHYGLAISEVSKRTEREEPKRISIQEIRQLN